VGQTFLSAHFLAGRNACPTLNATTGHAKWYSYLAIAVFYLMTCCSHGLEFVDNPSSGMLTLRDDAKDVLAYCYGDQLKPGVDAKYTRSCYIHPLYSIDGFMLTDDFPKDHPHHRGVSWTWPVVRVRGKTSQTWAPHDPSLRQHFVRWLRRETSETSAVLSVENAWKLSGKEEVARERVTVNVYPEKQDSRAIDVELELEALGGPLVLQGQQDAKKGYGGFCLRAAPAFAGAPMTTDKGREQRDVVNQSRRWVDLSTTASGVAIFVPPDHPGFPPPWLARNSYAGFLNPEWPGLPAVTLRPGDPVTLRYRIFVHCGNAQSAQVAQAYKKYGRAK
jgi:hypothetical protein